MFYDIQILLYRLKPFVGLFRDENLLQSELSYSQFVKQTCQQ